MNDPRPDVSADRLDALLGAAVDAIVLIDARGHITRFNRAAERLFGYASAQIVGQNVRVLMPADAAHEHDGYLRRYQAGGAPHIIGIGREVSAQRRDGSRFPIELSVGEFRIVDETGYVGILRDVSERHMQESRLRSKAEQLRLLLESAPTPVAVTDPDGRIQNANASLIALLGYGLTELRRKRLSDLVQDEDRAAVLADIEHLRAGEQTLQREVRLRHAQGQGVPVLLYSGCARDRQGRPLLVIAELLDRSALQQATREADELRERLAHAGRVGMLGEMVSGIAHEVNQPLTAIANYASAARRLIRSGHTSPDELVEILDKIGSQAERAGQVIRSLRAMIRKGQTVRERLDLRTLVEDVSRLVEIDLRGGAQHLVLDLAPVLPAVEGDGVQVQQVLVNLIRNAVEAMRESGRGQEVRLSATRDGEDHVLIRVDDQGPGLPDEVRGRLFDPFVTTKRQGLGLGLSICRSIVQAHGGELTYHGRGGGGASFHLRLPAAPEAA